MKPLGIAAVLACLLGVPAGIGAFTFVYAKGLHRKAQWRLDFVAAENSMGFHAPQEMARILRETIDYARQGQLEAARAAQKR